MGKLTTVLLADDHPLMRTGLRAALQSAGFLLMGRSGRRRSYMSGGSACRSSPDLASAASVPVRVVTPGNDRSNVVFFFVTPSGEPLANTSSATAWAPGTDGSVYTLALSGTLLYAGGSFTAIGGQPRNNIAALDTTLDTDNATAWNPNASGALSSSVNALALRGTTVYAGGMFTNIGSQPRANIAALDANSGEATSWNPGADNTVNALAIRGATIYIGGGFSAIGGQTRLGIGALDVDSEEVMLWNFDALGSVAALAVDERAVYIGGAAASMGCRRQAWPRSASYPGG